MKHRVQVRYRANRECPVFEELAGLFRKTSGVVGVLAEALQALTPGPTLALIFGSVARGDENARSDVDLLVVGDCSFADAVRTLHPVQEVIRREINPVVYTAAELAGRIKNGESFVANIPANPKLFVIGGEHELAELAGHPAPAGL